MFVIPPSRDDSSFLEGVLPERRPEAAQSTPVSMGRGASGAALWLGSRQGVVFGVIFVFRVLLGLVRSPDISEITGDASAVDGDWTTQRRRVIPVQLPVSSKVKPHVKLYSIDGASHPFDARLERGGGGGESWE
jgi:hypothetical protein